MTQQRATALCQVHSADTALCRKAIRKISQLPTARTTTTTTYCTTVRCSFSVRGVPMSPLRVHVKHTQPSCRFYRTVVRCIENRPFIIASKRRVEKLGANGVYTLQQNGEYHGVKLRDKHCSVCAYRRLYWCQGAQWSFTQIYILILHGELCTSLNHTCAYNTYENVIAWWQYIKCMRHYSGHNTLQSARRTCRLGANPVSDVLFPQGRVALAQHMYSNELRTRTLPKANQFNAVCAVNKYSVCIHKWTPPPKPPASVPSKRQRNWGRRLAD